MVQHLAAGESDISLMKGDQNSELHLLGGQKHKELVCGFVSVGHGKRFVNMYQLYDMKI